MHLKLIQCFVLRSNEHRSSVIVQRVQRKSIRSCKQFKLEGGLERMDLCAARDARDARRLGKTIDARWQ
eukprot:CCRYP_009015-RA/>CCRYP_009015-RA protein AED:0.51 eAED:1.00 QI:0/0/0/1/0/0/2/0/68